MPGRICAIVSCDNIQPILKEQGINTTFHYFPKGNDSATCNIRKEWIKRCRRADKFNVYTSTICSSHFTPDDYERDLQHELLTMAENAAAEAKPPTYFGKPENKKNPKAVQGQRPRPNKKEKKPHLPAIVNKDSQNDGNKPNLNDHTHISSWEEEIIANICVREVNIKTQFSPTFSAFPEVVQLTYYEMAMDNLMLSRIWTKEVFDYYCCALLWLRICHLKNKLADPLTTEEVILINRTQTIGFNLPEPIRLYLMGIGSMQTRTGQHLYPTFPPLPITAVDNIPGFYAPMINLENHNLHEEVPCLGVTCAMVCGSLNEADIFPQPNLGIIPPNWVANPNLLFLHHIIKPRDEAKQILHSCGINQVAFPCSPANSGFNIDLLNHVSSIIAGSTTFKVSMVNFSTAAEAGSISQTIPTHPTKNNDIAARAVTAEVIAQCLSAEPPESFCAAIVFGYQLYKENFENEPISWACITPTPPLVFPEEWTDNRNARRDLPFEYDIPVFTASFS